VFAARGARRYTAGMTGVTTDEFAPATREDWIKRVEGVLKDDDCAKRLVSFTGDSIRIDPLYQKAPGPRVARATHAPWAVIQRCDHPDAARANAQALDDLENGANGLALIFRGAASARDFGIDAHDPAAIGRVLKDVRLDLIALRLEPGPQWERVASLFAQWIANQPYDPERLDLRFGIDPVGVLAWRGDPTSPWSDTTGRMKSTVSRLCEQHFRGPFAVADGRLWHDGGASEVQELAYALATGVAYLRVLDGLDDHTLSDAVSITLAADQDMFLGLAKFRAMRLLWAQVLSECGLPSIKLKLHGETSWRMMTRRDPYSNILRATAAAFAAGLGGADSIAVLPFSIAQGLPDGFARRIARNTQMLLLEESNLWHVSDPASGSGYVEHLTRELADKAWHLFQSVERSGGIVEALATGAIQANIAEARSRRAERGETIIGTTDYLGPSEPSASIEVERPAASDAAARSNSILPYRIAESFEGPPSSPISGEVARSAGGGRAGGDIPLRPLRGHLPREGGGSSGFKA
jgi:methylmalonyl-CoA mutase